jgi:phospholipase C
VSHRYFFSNLSFASIWGFKYALSTGLFTEFLQRAAIGALPAVSFVDPSYTLLDDGSGNDDHPHADIRNGDAFLSTVFYALARGPAWTNTVLVIVFDEGGGFFDHVAPPRAVAANSVDTDLVGGQVLLGFRTPTIVVSPFTRNPGAGPRVNHTVFDHTSVLKLIEWRWNLQPLTPRDASPQIGNFATEMDFSSPNPAVPSLPRPGTVSAAPCFGSPDVIALTR